MFILFYATAVTEIESLLVIGKLAGREIRDALNWTEDEKTFLS